MSDDVYIGGGPGKHFKQPNPPVSPRWDTDPLRPEDIKPMRLPNGVRANIDNAPLTEPTMDTSNPATTQVLSGLSGVRKSSIKR